jgi:acyl-CoA synthetase (AMP-forming)/AMP-acid ligase II
MIFRSPFPEVEIPEVSLPEFVFARTSERAGKPALIDGVSGRVYTHGEIAALVRRAAAGLARRGFRKGDVLALFSPNLPEYAVAFHAAATLGGATTTINPLYTVEEVSKQLTDAGAKYMVTVPPLVGKAAEACEGSGVEELFVFGEAEGATPFAALLEGDDDPPRVEINAREDVVALPYSSGTTGESKGVCLTHRNLAANLAQIEGTRHASSEDTFVCVLPMFHIYGLNVILNYGLYAGATTVTLPRFDLEQTLRVVEDYRVTLGHFVPPIILALARHPSVENYDLSSLKTIFSGAAPLGEHVQRECARRLGCYIKQGYGMTETSPATHMVPHEPGRERFGSVGVLTPNTECKVIDLLSGTELGTEEEGEICVRGPQVMQGYLNKPEATARTIDSDGWLHTGDIGYADAEGCFYIVDRAKELIKYKGFQVAPAELEAVLLTHPAVADCAVIPCPDDEAGEVPVAYVVLRGETEAAEIISYVAERVAPHKKVRRVEVIEQIPKSPSGKILRRVLVARERERQRT